MSRKLCGALLPILAVVAFASISGVAQAVPHWYTCAEVAKEAGAFEDANCAKAKAKGNFEQTRLPFTSATTPVQTFGTLKLEASNGSTITCLVTDLGNIWNVALGTVGMDEITAFTNYSCTSNFCTAGLSLAAEGLAWPTELSEAGGKFFDKIGTVAKPVKIHLVCGTPATNVVFEGTLVPEFVNGTSGLASFANFNKTAGLAGGGLTATVTGHDFVIGAANDENIIVKNP
jgi:hypothetical protein